MSKNDIINASNNTKHAKDGKLYTFENGIMKPVDVLKWNHEGKKIQEYVDERKELLKMKEQYALAQKPHCVFTLKGRRIIHGVNVPGKGYITASQEIPDVINTALYKSKPYLDLDENDKIVIDEVEYQKYKLGGIL